MAHANISFRMDSDLKEEFAELCDEIGLSMSAAFCVFAKAAVRKRGIPFEVSALDENGLTPEEVEDLKSRLHDIKTGKNIEEHKLIDV